MDSPTVAYLRYNRAVLFIVDISLLFFNQNSLAIAMLYSSRDYKPSRSVVIRLTSIQERNFRIKRPQDVTSIRSVRIRNRHREAKHRFQKARPQCQNLVHIHTIYQIPHVLFVWRPTCFSFSKPSSERIRIFAFAFYSRKQVLGPASRVLFLREETNIFLRESIELFKCNSEKTRKNSAMSHS